MGEHKAYTRLLRKTGVYNPIPSKYRLRKCPSLTHPKQPHSHRAAKAPTARPSRVAMGVAERNPWKQGKGGEALNVAAESAGRDGGVGWWAREDAGPSDSGNGGIAIQGTGHAGFRLSLAAVCRWQSALIARSTRSEFSTIPRTAVAEELAFLPDGEFKAGLRLTI